MFIPDLHSFTTPINHNTLYDQIILSAKLFVAAGLPLNNEDIHLYRQSTIAAHSELTWILSCFASFGQLSRMTQFKDKSASKDEVSTGLFIYPVLMAADILLYGAKYVPVGDDQTQHLEFTRDIAERMNSRFGELFTVPEPVHKQHEFFGNDQGLRIMDLVDPSKKMSKSDDTGRGVIFLSDAPEAAAKKIMSATTDDKANVAYDPLEQPGISNLLQILALITNLPLETVIQQHAGISQYGAFKQEIAIAVSDFLTLFQQNLETVDTNAVFKKLESSEAAMNLQANQTVHRAQQAVGLRKKD